MFKKRVFNVFEKGHELGRFFNSEVSQTPGTVTNLMGLVKVFKKRVFNMFKKRHRFGSFLNSVVSARYSLKLNVFGKRVFNKRRVFGSFFNYKKLFKTSTDFLVG